MKQIINIIPGAFVKEKNTSETIVLKDERPYYIKLGQDMKQSLARLQFKYTMWGRSCTKLFL